MFGRDKESFKNAPENIPEEEEFLAEWRRHGALSILYDILTSINTPQHRRLFERLQREQDPESRVKAVIKPIKTRWNSYYLAFERAVELWGALDAYSNLKIQDHQMVDARSRAHAMRLGHNYNPPLPMRFIEYGGLSPYDWTVINEYIRILSPIKEASKILEGRGRAGRHGAVWEIIVTFDILFADIQKQRADVIDVTQAEWPSQDPVEDHVIINVTAAIKKLEMYLEKVNQSPVYYAATVLNPSTKSFTPGLRARTLRAMGGVQGNAGGSCRRAIARSSVLRACPRPAYRCALAGLLALS
jgi:hypothetical protein